MLGGESQIVLKNPTESLGAQLGTHARPRPHRLRINVPFATHETEIRRNCFANRFTKVTETELSRWRRAAPRAADSRYQFNRPHAKAVATVSGQAMTVSVLVQKSGSSLTMRQNWVVRSSRLPGASA